jgi:hypothetical protein
MSLMAFLINWGINAIKMIKKIFLKLFFINIKVLRHKSKIFSIGMGDNSVEDV